MRKGLTMGCIPIAVDPPKLMHGFRWLTKNKKWEQAWCDPRISSLPYRRNAYRLTIKIPKRFKHKVINWLSLCKTDKIPKLTSDALNAFGDPDNWRLYQGDIDPRWIIEVKRNPNL